jgi:3-deoxy-D-manno-octulosonic-acid transferase
MVKRTLIEVGYRTLTILAFPLLLLYLALRVARDRRYAHGLGERLGILPRSFQRTVPGAVWLHAVSVGEVLAAVPLLKQMKTAMPWAPVYVSVTTLAGRAMADQKLAGLAAGVFFTPADMAFAIRGVLRTLKPALVVVMETEIWPNLYAQVKRSGASLVIVNGRISDKAMPAYRHWRWFFRAPLSRPDAILAQDERAAARYRELGAKQVEAAGNLKYDFDPEATRIAPLVQALVDRLQPATILIAASTMPPDREGDPDEDDLVIYTILKLHGRFPRMLLLWAPRKPERFDAAAERLQAAGIPFVRRSQLSSGASLQLPGVLLVDTMGELAGLFRLGNAVFMGGTFPHRGGHNPLEPAAFGVAIVAGPHMENFTEIAADFDAQSAWVRVEDHRELGGVLVSLLDDRERQQELGARARALAEARRGATARVVAVLREAYENALPAPLAPLWQRLTLGPLSWVWRAGVWVDRAIKSGGRSRLCCVVSVGNLSVGGTGKTPFVVWLCARLKEQGRTPGVLLRGYRRRSGPAVLTLAAGQVVPVESAGEEALIHLRAGYGPVGVGADRARVLIELQARYGIDCAVADDGFQHWRLRRDCDIVLIDALDPLSGGVLPLGRLREDFSALRRAHAVVVTRTVVGRSYAGLLGEIRRWNPVVPVFLSRIVAGLESLPAGAGAFCGLGNPEAFRTTLGEIRVASEATSEPATAAPFFQPVFFEVFEDHHRYTESEIEVLLERAAVLVTTEKDWLNLPERFKSDSRIWVLPIRVIVERGSELLSLVRERLQAAAARA